MAQASTNQAGSSSGVEQRKSPRKKVLLTGKIISDAGAIVFDCTIRDLSATGARVTLAQARAIPQGAYLLDLANRMAYETVVVSERAGGFGLKFNKAMKLADVTAPELRFLKRIWMECAR
ncbi:MAG TPA: PilZ domain-containing protein [Micropepsaceae bacterium]|nr:PilZ domain-containing protein [Micropepsaceae bacterium]